MNTEPKRRHTRISSKKVSCTFVCINEKNEVITQGNGFPLDVSESGLLLETDMPIASQQILLLTIPVEDDIAEVKGKVVHCKTNGNGKFKIGLEFLEIEWFYGA